MSTDFKTSIVSILDEDKKTVGTGFVVSSDGLIATCAHVATKAEANGYIQLIFYDPGIPKESRDVRVARIEPDYFRNATAEDVAILRLQGPLPTPSVPLSLGSSFNTEEKMFLSFGFPEAKPEDGLLGGCEVLGIVSEEGLPLLQLRSNEVAKGFSGAPVWDESRQVVVGMINSIIGARQVKIAGTKISVPFDSDARQTETAFASPAETLQKICPPLQIVEECPYRGLDAFTEKHTRFFFGREHDVERLLGRLKHDIRFLAVLGPSGSGKSSVVQAGLIPQLRQGAIVESERWGVIVIRPADDPFKQLAEQGVADESRNLKDGTKTWLAQHPQQTRLVLVIDQFEELLTACSETVYQEFLAQLLQLLGSPQPITIIITMRDDFYGQFVRQETLAEWLERGLVNIPQTLKPAEVAAIVQRPAEIVRLRFEEGLVEIIVKNALENRPSPTNEGRIARSTILPLLEFALTQLWERRKEGKLTREAYDAIGGVTGGLTLWADRVFYGFEDEEKQWKARHIFTELVHLGNEEQGLPDSRRRMPLAALCRNDRDMEETQQIVQKLADSKLLVTTYDMQNRQEVVEIIHDALLWEWGEMRRWLQEDRQFLIWHQEIEEQARAWVETNVEHPARRDKYKLLRRADLKEALQHMGRRSNDLSQIEKDFIEASRKLQERGRVYIAAAGLVGLGLVLFGGAEVAAFLIPRYTDMSPFRGQHSQVWHIAWSPDNTRIASTSGGGSDYKVQVWSTATDNSTYFYSKHRRSVTSVTWSPDSYRIASGSYDQTVQVWSSDGLIHPPNTYPAYIYSKHTDYILTVAWSPDSKYIASGAAAYDKTVQVWRADPERIGELVSKYSGHKDSVDTVAWSPDSKHIASGSGDNTVQVWEATTGKNVYIYRGHKSHVLSVAWSPNGKYIASGGLDKTVQVWAAETGEHIYTYSGHTKMVAAIAWSPDSKYIASAGEDQTVQVWDVLNKNLICTYGEHHSKVRSVAWSPLAKERLIASAGDDKLVRVWRLKE